MQTSNLKGKFRNLCSGIEEVGVGGGVLPYMSRFRTLLQYISRFHEN